jgi:hypothetical protein
VNVIINPVNGTPKELRDELVADYGATYGLWHYDPVRGWTQLNTANPDQMLAVDTDNDGKEELIATFSGYGLYTYDPVDGWIRINATLPDAMIRMNSGVVCDYGSTYGLWYWTKTGGWVRWNASDPGQLLAVDIDNDGTDELIASFAGYGLYTYDPVDGWIRINATLPDAMIRLNSGVVCDYGSTYGLWYWTKTGGWIRWNSADPNQLLAVDIDHDGTDELIASFAGYGLYTYEPTTMGWVRINATLPDNMKPVDFFQQ